MNTLVKTASTVSMLTVLAACGGSSNPEEPVSRSFGSEVFTTGENPAGLTATYDSETNTVTISDGETDRVYDAEATNGVISIYVSDRGSTGWVDFATYGETSTGSGIVKGINSTLPGIEALGVEFERIGVTLVPDSGSVAYTGSYLGQFYGFEGASDEQPVGYGYVTGNVTLTADFGDVSTIFGTITDRNGELADINLELASITNGGFVGTATGGEAFGQTTSNGVYGGLLTGADATEIVGGLEIEHSTGDCLSFCNEVEVGVFIAEQPVP